MNLLYVNGVSFTDRVFDKHTLSALFDFTSKAWNVSPSHFNSNLLLISLFCDLNKQTQKTNSHLQNTKDQKTHHAPQNRYNLIFSQYSVPELTFHKPEAFLKSILQTLPQQLEPQPTRHTTTSDDINLERGQVVRFVINDNLEPLPSPTPPLTQIISRPIKDKRRLNHQPKKLSLVIEEKVVKQHQSDWSIISEPAPPQDQPREEKPQTVPSIRPAPHDQAHHTHAYRQQQPESTLSNHSPSPDKSKTDLKDNDTLQEQPHHLPAKDFILLDTPRPSSSSPPSPLNRTPRPSIAHLSSTDHQHNHPRLSATTPRPSPSALEGLPCSSSGAPKTHSSPSPKLLRPSTADPSSRSPTSTVLRPSTADSPSRNPTPTVLRPSTADFPSRKLGSNFLSAATVTSSSPSSVRPSTTDPCSKPNLRVPSIEIKPPPVADLSPGSTLQRSSSASRSSPSTVSRLSTVNPSSPNPPSILSRPSTADAPSHQTSNTSSSSSKKLRSTKSFDQILGNRTQSLVAQTKVHKKTPYSTILRKKIIEGNHHRMRLLVEEEEEGEGEGLTNHLKPQEEAKVLKMRIPIGKIGFVEEDGEDEEVRGE